MKKEANQSVREVAENRLGKEKLAQLESLYPGRHLNVIVVEDKVAVLAPLTAKALSDYTRCIADQSEKGGFDKAAHMIIEQLWLEGDAEIRDDEEFFMGAMVQVMNIVEVKKSVFGRL